MQKHFLTTPLILTAIIATGNNCVLVDPANIFSQGVLFNHPGRR